MSKAAQLVERVPLRYSYLTIFYYFGENFEFKSRLTVQYLKTQQNPNGKSPVICSVVSWANILCSSFKN